MKKWCWGVHFWSPGCWGILPCDPWRTELCACILASSAGGWALCRVCASLPFLCLSFSTFGEFRTNVWFVLHWQKPAFLTKLLAWIYPQSPVIAKQAAPTLPCQCARILTWKPASAVQVCLLFTVITLGLCASAAYWNEGCWTSCLIMSNFSVHLAFSTLFNSYQITTSDPLSYFFSLLPSPGTAVLYPTFPVLGQTAILAFLWVLLSSLVHRCVEFSSDSWSGLLFTSLITSGISHFPYPGSLCIFDFPLPLNFLIYVPLPNFIVYVLYSLLSLCGYLAWWVQVFFFFFIFRRTLVE